MRVFLSYQFGDRSLLVHRVSSLLNKQPGIESYCWVEPRKPAEWEVLLDDVLNTSDAMVFFASKEPGKTQVQEVEVFNRRERGPSLVIRLTATPESKPGPFSDVYAVMGKREENWGSEPMVSPAIYLEGARRSRHPGCMC